MQLKNDLNNRIEEVEIYFAFAKEVDSIEPHKLKKVSLSETTQITVKRDLQKVLRANCYLLLYNLIESTIKNGIWATLDAIQDDNISYSKAAKSIQSIWLREKSQELNEISNHSKLKENIKTILDEQLSSKGITFTRDRISISGNLDYRSIEKIISEFGFHGKISVSDKGKLGRALLKIKNERNALAHGNKSFRQSAEIVTIQELFEYKDFAISYLRDITDNIIKYIQNRSYLAKS